MCVSVYVHATIHMSQCVHTLCLLILICMPYACVCACMCVACNLLHGSHVQHSCDLLCSPNITPPMYSLHKYTHTHTHTYIATSHLLSLPSVLFSPISPLCPTQESRLADVMTTSALGQLKVPQDNVHCMCTSLCFLLFPSYSYLFLYVFVLVDYVFFSSHSTTCMYVCVHL